METNIIGKFVLFLFPQLTVNKMQIFFFTKCVRFLVKCLNIAGPLWLNGLDIQVKWADL